MIFGHGLARWAISVSRARAHRWGLVLGTRTHDCGKTRSCQERGGGLEMTGPGDSGARGQGSELEVTAELVRAYDSGATITELAARFGMTYYKARASLISAGVELRQVGPTTPSAPPGLVQAYLDGATIHQVAKRFGLSFGVARRMLLQDGVQLRPKGGGPSGTGRP
ncbi:helix-turn-helix domain-containing protein [Amycolatopsis thailandensis]|uniref:helix-turn-helix domain-containing protein n=1 Tax=Amycolatopsis thailandensis TaxID=589330 RepID=UPI0037AB8D0C